MLHIISKLYRFVKMAGKWLKSNLGLILFGVFMFGVGLIQGGRFLKRPPIMITGDVVNIADLKESATTKVKEVVSINGFEDGFVASSRGKYYYPVSCKLAANLSPANLLHFSSKAEAEKAGYIYQTKCD